MTGEICGLAEIMECKAYRQHPLSVQLEEGTIVNIVDLDCIQILVQEGLVKTHLLSASESVQIACVIGTPGYFIHL